METEIDLLINELGNRFDQGWFDRTIDIHEKRPVYKEVKSKLARFLTIQKKFFFDKFNLSVLKGEYAIDSSLDKKLSEYKSFLDSYTVVTNHEDISVVNNLILNEFRNEFIETLIKALDWYLILINEFNNRVNLIEISKSVIGSNLMSIQMTELKFNRRYSKESDLKYFLLNLKVAFCDLKMRPDVFFVEFFYYAIQSLEDASLLGVHRTKVALLQKTKFLYSKLILRRYHDNEGAQYKYSQGYALIQDPVTECPEQYRTFLDYAIRHYELSQMPLREITAACEPKLLLKLENIKLIDIHLRIKYFKDVKKSVSSLGKIVEFLISQSNKDDLAREENYYLSVAITYAINNLLSLHIELDSPFETIENIFENALLLQEKSKVKDYFADFKFLEYLIGILDNLSSSGQIITEVSRANLIVSKCIDLVNSYQNKILWTNEQYNYIFSLPFKECMVDSSNADIGEMFIYSSFLLPLSKEKYHQEFEENKQKVFRYQASISVINNLSKDILNLKEEQTNINKRESKSMEIIGIFTAMVTFVAGTIQSFGFISTPFQAVMFTISFGSALFLFVLLLLVSNRIEIKRTAIFWFVVVGLAMAISWALVFNGYFKWKQKVSENLRCEPTGIEANYRDLDIIDSSIRKVK